MSSDEEIDITGEDDNNANSLVKELAGKTEGCTTGRVTSHPRAAKSIAWRKQLMKKYQMPETRTLDSKNKKKKKKRIVKSKENISKMIKDTNSSGGDKDLDINVEAFVYHSPVLDDIDQVPETSSCPFCSVLCRDKQDVTRHIKDCHNSGKPGHWIHLITIML